jgi:hypothetical protein
MPETFFNLENISSPSTSNQLEQHFIEKPKRKRRTKAEMLKFRAKQAKNAIAN